MRKTVLITGASRGIGRAIAVKFAQHDYNVVINYCHSHESAERLAGILREQNPNIMTVCADVSDMTQVEKMRDEIAERFGGVDVLVNNAGVSLEKLLIDTTADEWDSVISTNLTSVYNTTHTFCPCMISQKYGKIVNVSSVWGERGASMEVAYSASKGGVIAFTRALAKELAPSGVKVNCVCPGVIDTDMLDVYTADEKADLVSRTPMGRLGTPKDIADAVYFLSSDQSDFISGQVLTVDGLFE